MSNPSEFGRGYVTCLWQFANHSERIDDFKTMFKHLPSVAGSDMDMWFNASSDHLYELKHPKTVSNADWKEAQALAQRALAFGHGFGALPPATEADARYLIGRAIKLVLDMAIREGVGYPETLDEAIALDAKLGLRAEGGSWSCAENFKKT